MPNRAHVTDGPGTESRHAGIFALGESVVYPNDGPFDWISLAKSKVPFLTHCPIDKEFIARCHGLGIRCLPYVQFYMGGAQVTLVNDTSDSYEGVRWADHADWGDVRPVGRSLPVSTAKMALTSFSPNRYWFVATWKRTGAPWWLGPATLWSTERMAFSWT